MRDVNPLIPTNMHGAAVPHRLAMGLPPSVPISLGNAVLAPSKSLRSMAHSQKSGPHGDGCISLASLRTIRNDAPSRFQHSRNHSATMIGGSMRLSASDAALVALSAPARPSGSPPARPRERDPITGKVPEPTAPSRSATASSETVFRFGAREFDFPARGTIGSVGGERVPSRQQRKLEYKLWQETQRREAAERALRTVTIHGRSLPPWIAEVPQAGGEFGLMPQYRSA